MRNIPPLSWLFDIRFVCKMAAGLAKDVFPPLALLLKVREVADKYVQRDNEINVFAGLTAFFTSTGA